MIETVIQLEAKNLKRGVGGGGAADGKSDASIRGKKNIYISIKAAGDCGGLSKQDERKSDDSISNRNSKKQQGGGDSPHCRGHRIPEKNRYVVVVENVCGGPWIYSARESNMLIVEELRMDPWSCSCKALCCSPFVMAAE